MAIAEKVTPGVEGATGTAHRLTASEITSLKAAIKAEMARRKGYGSLSSTSSYGYADGPSAAQVDYSSSTYDFTTVPQSGARM